HELRTPLNSVLVLGQQLSENPDGNLTDKQVEFARTIHGAGTDLLNLISDILDLSKIESGTVTVECEEITFPHLLDLVQRNFGHVADARRLAFNIDFDATLGAAITTDPKRLLQVLKNLLSNAFKFTEQGGVRLEVAPAKGGWTPTHPILSAADQVVRVTVADTGVGIPPEKQRIIFEAFQQADAGTSRKYGGTGLGLAISRELANLLGGEIKLQSTPGVGSVFTLFLPLRYAGSASGGFSARNEDERLAFSQPIALPHLPAAAAEIVPDDRDEIEPGDLTLLIVEDDPHYAQVLLSLARDQGFKGLVAMRGAEALSLARKYKPTALSLDIALPDMLGWTVLSQLKQDPATRHIPVQIVTVEEERQHGLERGAFAYLNKPLTTEGLEVALDRMKKFVATRTRRLLVIEDDPAERLSISELIRHDDVEIVAVATGAEALATLRSSRFDCAVLDLRLPDISGFELLGQIQKDPLLRDVPIVVFTGRSLSADEERTLRKMAKSIVLKGVQSPERLLDETALFLHRVIPDLPASKRRMIETLTQSDEPLIGKKVLVVDDDVRNIFALTSLLERHRMQTVTAASGAEAIEIMQRTPNISLALMDIMMPEMDGYETMRRIRKNRQFNMLPIIALTAKAMKGDREKCLEAGASDYIAKPVNSEQLLSLLRTWLHR
ncbi:MAG: response regulator, partial [Burkholderiales bacterium]